MAVNLSILTKKGEKMDKVISFRCRTIIGFHANPRKNHWDIFHEIVFASCVFHFHASIEINDILFHLSGLNINNNMIRFHV